MGVRLAPSILSADFSRLGDEVRAVERGGAGLIHVDVMDGHFVPNLTLGPAIVRAVRGVTRLPLDCHLMIDNPDDFLEPFADAGADMISVHVEVARHLHRTVHAIRDRGARPGVVLNPATPLTTLDEILPEVDFVLLMSVNPGFGGQRMIPAVLDKARALRSRIDEAGLDCLVEIDGGVNEDNLDRIARAGVDLIVAGSAVFGDDDPQAATARMVARLGQVERHDRDV